MTICENHPLKNLNTFGLDVYARYYTEIRDEKMLYDLFRVKELFQNKHLILGEGSNILFSGDYDGTVVRIMLKGIEVTGKKDGYVFIRVNAGEIWDHLVSFCVSQGWGGLENLSLIPGQVGSSPIQNIGAYGVELETLFVSLEAFDKLKGESVVFRHKDCQFGYRNSVFKGRSGGRYVITSVTLRLKEDPELNTSYGSVAEELKNMGISSPGIKDVREAVCRIRRSKLPDPEDLGNAGSFFKNPVVPLRKYNDLKSKHPDLVAYGAGNGMKLAAGWLIDKAGWKGYRHNDAGVHEKQALVLVNHGKASGKEILDLAGRIKDSVSRRFGVSLEPEVNII